MNIAESFVTYMEGLGLGTLGTDIFIAGAPKSAPASCWWVVLNGGIPLKTDTGEVQKEYSLNVYYRSNSQSGVYDQLNNFEIEVNKAHCTQLTGFDTIDMSAITFPTDQDLDNEDRTVGLTQVTITTYYKE